MKKEKLIEELEKLPDGIEVCIFDYRKNLANDIGDGSSEGVYSDFEISVESLEGEEAEWYREQHNEEFIPWASLCFDNFEFEE
jgi:hypothetical protein